MCDNCKQDCTYGPTPHSIDWTRIPAGLNEVRRLPSGSVWAGVQFRVIDCTGAPSYQFQRSVAAQIADAYTIANVLARRPEVRADYLIHCPGVYPEMVPGVTKQGLQEHLNKAGYGPQVRVYKLVAEAKQVEIKTIETQLVWSN